MQREKKRKRAAELRGGAKSAAENHGVSKLILILTVLPKCRAKFRHVETILTAFAAATRVFDSPGGRTQDRGCRNQRRREICR